MPVGARPRHAKRVDESKKLMRLLFIRPASGPYEAASPDPLAVSRADDCSSTDYITGAVLSCRTHVIYVLEGWEQRVADVLVEFFNDRTQTRPVVVEQTIVGARQFREWSRLRSEAAGYFERCICEVKDAPGAERIIHVERLVEVLRLYAAD